MISNRDTARSGTTEPFISRVRISNYKSIGKCDLGLAPLTVLVGRNGAGKSNFLDAFRFITDGLRNPLDHAVKSRGGIGEVRRRSSGHPRNFAIRLTINLPKAAVGDYGFELGAQTGGGFFVKREFLKIVGTRNEDRGSFRVNNSALTQSSIDSKAMPPPSDDRLYLVAAAGRPEFRPVYDALSSMGFYNMNPQSMKELQSPDAGNLLHRDGANVASVIARLGQDNPVAVDRIKQYLGAIVPGVKDVMRESLGPKETLLFRQDVAGAKNPWKFYASSMSDGTLRALGALLAVMQLADREHAVRLVGIEEPETALHPAAAGALMEALREATAKTQVIVTSHSPEFLERVDVERDGLLVVESRQGNTYIAPVGRTGREAIKEHLYDAGELLRMDQLEPDEDDLARQEQLELFDSDGDGA